MVLRGQKKLKIIDRYFGIPLISFLGLIKKKKQIPSKIKSVGILLTPAIGDTIIISAPLKDLKKELNPDNFILFVPSENREAAELMDISSDIISINLINLIETIKTIRKYNFDLFIDTSQWARINSLISYFSKSKFTIGFNTKDQHRKQAYDLTSEHSNTVHEITNYRNLFSLIGINSQSIPGIKTSNQIDSKKISLHLVPGGYLSYLKEWKQENWIELIKYLLSKDYMIYFTGSSHDQNYISTVINKVSDKKNLFNLAGKLSLMETAEHLSSCKLVISVNTGIMHLAAAVRANLIALHGPTDPVRWGPLNKNSIIIKSNYLSAPCLNLGFEYNCNDRTGECMKMISVSEVISAVDSFIKN